VTPKYFTTFVIATRQLLVLIRS